MSSLEESSGKNVPTSYRIHKVDTLVNIPEEIVLPKELLELNPNQNNLIDNELKKHFEFLLNICGLLSRLAFEYWISLLRLKSVQWYAAQPEIIDSESGWVTYLLDKKTSHRFWVEPHRFTAHIPYVFTRKDMNAVINAAINHLKSPIWYEFLFDAEHKFANGDLNGCVLSLAITCESMFRRIIECQIPDTKAVDPEIFRTLDEINIRSIFKHLKKFKFWNEDWAKNCDIKLMHELFDLRNDIIHACFFREMSEDHINKIK